jgi:hypothetical protein
MLGRITRIIAVIFAVLTNWPAMAACPRIFDPVCAVEVARQLRTFNNKCEALQERAKYLHDGPCFHEFCSHLCLVHGVYARGVFSGRLKLYDNLCWAEKDFAQYGKEGPCPRP